jgi:hypothetical protein
MNKVIPWLLLLIVGLAYYATADSQSLTKEEVIAQCQRIAIEKSSAMRVPFVAGAVDSRAWPSYHPCKNTYFEESCRMQVQRESFRNCVQSLSRR